jgi:hypothetical protein
LVTTLISSKILVASRTSLITTIASVIPVRTMLLMLMCPLWLWATVLSISSILPLRTILILLALLTLRTIPAFGFKSRLNSLRTLLPPIAPAILTFGPFVQRFWAAALILVAAVGSLLNCIVACLQLVRVPLVPVIPIARLSSFVFGRSFERQFICPLFSPWLGWGFSW